MGYPHCHLIQYRSVSLRICVRMCEALFRQLGPVHDLELAPDILIHPTPLQPGKGVLHL
jgi:hypothetical protein